MSFWLELFVVLGTLLLGGLYWLKRRYAYFKDQGVPYLPPIPLLGSTYKALFGFERFGESYTRAYKELSPARFGGLFQVWSPVYVIRDPELVTQVMAGHFSHFHSHGIKVDPETNPLEGHLFNLDGEAWRLLRNRLSPTFTSGRLKWMFPQMEVCTKALLSSLEGQKDVEVRDLLARFTTDVIGSCAFGYEPEAIKDKDCKFREVGKKVFAPDLKQVLMLGLRLAFPETFLKLKLKTVPTEINDFFTSVLRQSFEHRLKTGEKRHDFVELLLQLRERGSVETDPRDLVEESVASLAEEGHPPEKLELTDEVLTAQAFVFFVAGFETSSTAMSFTTYLLAKHPKIQDKVREEVRRVKAKHQGQITYDALKEMAYLEAAISETLRLYPPLEVHFRMCKKEYMLEGVVIPKDTPVMIPAYAIHHDPELWDAPEEYRPERFIESQPTPGTYIPFGYGPRICIGQRFALLELKLCLATLIDNYLVTPSPKMKEPVKFNSWSFILQPIDGLWVTFKKLES